MRSTSEQNTDSRFVENNELVFSVRSAVKHLGTHLSSIHILTPDFEREDDSEGRRLGESEPFTVEEGETRVGQVPSWINVDLHDLVAVGESARPSGTSPSSPFVYVQHNWDSFHPIDQSENVNLSDEAAIYRWKKEHLPTFNSIAIELTMGRNERGLGEAYYSAVRAGHLNLLRSD